MSEKSESTTVTEIINKSKELGKRGWRYTSEFIDSKPKASAVIAAIFAFFIANQFLLFPIFSPDGAGQRQISGKLEALYGHEGTFMFFSFWAHIGIALTVYLIATFVMRKMNAKE